MSPKIAAALLGRHTKLDVQPSGQFWYVRLLDRRTGRFIRSLERFRTREQALRYAKTVFQLARRSGAANPAEPPAPAGRYRIQALLPDRLHWITITSTDKEDHAIVDAVKRARVAPTISLRVRDTLTGRVVWKGEGKSAKLPAEWRIKPPSGLVGYEPFLNPIRHGRTASANLHSKPQREQLEPDIAAMKGMFRGAVASGRVEEARRIVGWFEGLASAAQASKAPPSYIKRLRGIARILERRIPEYSRRRPGMEPPEAFINARRRGRFAVFVYVLGRIHPWHRIGSYESLRAARMVARKKAKETGCEVRIQDVKTGQLIDRFLTGRRTAVPPRMNPYPLMPDYPKHLEVVPHAIVAQRPTGETYLVSIEPDEEAAKTRIFQMSHWRKSGWKLGMAPLMNPLTRREAARLLRDARRELRFDTLYSVGKASGLSKAVQVTGPKAAEAVASAIRAKAMKRARILASEAISNPIVPKEELPSIITATQAESEGVARELEKRGIPGVRWGPYMDRWGVWVDPKYDERAREIYFYELIPFMWNPRISKRQLLAEAKKLYRAAAADVRAGHREAAAYWKGKAAGLAEAALSNTARRLAVVKPGVQPVYVICYRCGKSVRIASGEEPVYADLAGKPYRSYYCSSCAAVLLARPRSNALPGRRVSMKNADPIELNPHAGLSGLMSKAEARRARQFS